MQSELRALAEAKIVDTHKCVKLSLAGYTVFGVDGARRLVLCVLRYGSKCWELRDKLRNGCDVNTFHIDLAIVLQRIVTCSREFRFVSTHRYTHSHAAALNYDNLVAAAAAATTTTTAVVAFTAYTPLYFMPFQFRHTDSEMWCCARCCGYSDAIEHFDVCGFSVWMCVRVEYALLHEFLFVREKM